MSRASAAQLALFTEMTGRAQALADWQARFARVEMVIMVGPQTATHGPQIPRTVLGWKCPACGDVTSEFLIGNNHGYHPDRPGSVPFRAEFGSTCVKLHLQAAHKAYDERRAKIRHLIAAGLDDEQIAAQVPYTASTIAGWRKDEAKAARLAAKAAKGEIVTVGHGDGCPCAFCDGPCRCPSCKQFRADPLGTETGELVDGRLF
jgi:hypothetical protein